MFFSVQRPLSCFIFLLVLSGVCFASTYPVVPAPTFLSIPLTSPNHGKPSNGTEYVHGSIIQQQHANRALNRFALMTGRVPPSECELLARIYARILRLSTHHQRRYEIVEIAEILEDCFECPEYKQNGKSNASDDTQEEVHVHEKRRTLVSTDSTKGDPSIRNIGLSIELNDYGYMVIVKMGSPPRNFNLLVDSGSADLWVGAEGCRGDDGGTCGNHTFLGAHSSRTYNESKEGWAIGYVSGSVAGYLVEDDVSIAGLQLKGHRFGVALNESNEFTPDVIPFDGLLGLGKEMISQQGVPTLLQALYRANLIPAPIVSYKIPRLADGYNNGEMTLGGMDSRRYNRKTLVVKNNVNRFGFWGVAVDGVTVGNRNMNWSNRTVIMDTGTTVIIAPLNDVTAIHSHIPGARYDGSGWIVPCNMTTSIALTIGGQRFPIDPRDIAFYPVEYGSAECMSGIAVGGVGPFYLDNEWLVGDVFLKNVYFSTDDIKDQISIARPQA